MDMYFFGSLSSSWKEMKKKSVKKKEKKRVQKLI